MDISAVDTMMEETLKETENNPVKLLPPSSAELPISNKHVLAAISTYRTLTQTYNLYNLTFEDYCCALGHHDQCLIISHVHMLLIDDLLSKELEANGNDFSTFDLFCSTKLDEVTWPFLLRQYLLKNNRSELLDRDYYTLTIEAKLDLLIFLLDSYHKFDKRNPQLFGADPIGIDSKGTIFWFSCKRIITFNKDTGDVRYYSTKEKLDELLSYFDLSNNTDVEVSERIKSEYYDILDLMNETLVNIVLAYKTAQNKSLQSPAKYSGITYGDQATNTVTKRDIESMSMSSLLSTVRQASEEKFTFGSDRLYLRYKAGELPTKLCDGIKQMISSLGLTINHELTWKSTSNDQVKLIRNLLLDIASKIPKYFMHDAWEKRITPWENSVFKACTIHHLAACLAFLESHMRPILFSGEWKRNTVNTVPMVAESRNSSTDDTKLSADTPDVTKESGDSVEGEKENTEKNLSESLVVKAHTDEEGFKAESTAADNKPEIEDSKEKIGSERLTELLNQLQNKETKHQRRKVIPIPNGFTKIVDNKGRIMFKLPAGAQLVKVTQSNMTRVHYTSTSLQSPAPQPLKVIPPDAKPATITTQQKSRNIIIGPQVAKSLLKSPHRNIKGNVILRPHLPNSLMMKAFKSVDDPREILEKLFDSWGDEEISVAKKNSKIASYLYGANYDTATPTVQNSWRSTLRNIKDIADVAVLTSVLCSNMRWNDLSRLTILSDNKYECDNTTTVQRIVVDSRHGGNPISAQYKIVVMKQLKEEGFSTTQQLGTKEIQNMMSQLDVGVHDLWVNEEFVTFNELYTYQHNQEKLKSIENAKIQEEKKKEKEKAAQNEKKEKSYIVDAETTMVVRRVLSNILDRIEIEEKREKERRGKRKSKSKKSRGPSKSTDEKEQIRYFGKLDILLGRRKEQLKKTFFKKRQYLAFKIREEMREEEEEAKRVEAERRQKEEKEMAEKRRKALESEKRKREKEKRIRKAQESIERKLHKLQKNVELKTSTEKRKQYAKSPKRPAVKAPKPIYKKSSIKIDSHLKGGYKSKLQPKTKFKFPPKKPVVKKSGKISITPRKAISGVSSKLLASPFRDELKILGKRKLTREEKRIASQPLKRLCVEIRPVKITRKEKVVLERRLNQYQRSIAKSLTTEDISHPVIDIRKKPMKGAAKRAADKANIRERLQKLRKIATAKNRGNEVLAKLLLKQELVKKLAAQGDSSETTSSKSEKLAERKMVLQHHKNSQNKVAPSTKKKDTLYCICKRPYDHTRFYIGCDVCNNWYHGKCVGISPSMARNMSGYTCDGCKTKTTVQDVPTTSEKISVKEKDAAEPEGDLFCICRTPYNQYSFYIGCDSCQEWYHGTCVGISEIEAEKIEVYICDKCKQQQGREEPKLTHIQIAGLIKILRELQMHKMSWPFREPNKNEDPTVIKEPMDLTTIHKKFQKKYYPKLTLFVKDVLRVFSNTRQVYSEDSQRGRCADTLERYFVAKLNEFKLRHGLS